MRGLLGIHSPSTLFEEFGQNTIQGFINGIQASLPQLNSAVAGAFGGVPAVAGVGALAAPAVNNNFQPIINVRIGDEPLVAIVDTQISANNQQRNRVAAQGVRR